MPGRVNWCKKSISVLPRYHLKAF